MGVMDSIKAMTKGKKPQIKDGIDKGADVVQGKVGEVHSDKVDKAAEAAKSAVDKLPD